MRFNDLYRILNGKIYKVRAINKENKAVSFFEAKCIFIPLKKRDFIHPELGTIDGYSGTILTALDLPDSNFNTLELLIEDAIEQMHKP